LPNRVRPRVARLVWRFVRVQLHAPDCSTPAVKPHAASPPVRSINSRVVGRAPAGSIPRRGFSLRWPGRFRPARFSATKSAYSAENRMHQYRRASSPVRATCYSCRAHLIAHHPAASGSRSAYRGPAG
jgi:hypothetical protein